MRQFINAVRLNEWQIPHNLADQIVVYVRSAIDWSGGDGEQIYEEYRRENDIDEEEEINEESFNEWFSDWVSNQYGDAEMDIEDHFENGELPIYRCITAPRNFKPDPARHPGIYWTWDYFAAEAHWGSFSRDHVEWVLEARVPASAINWVATLGQNAVPSFGQEKEIRLVDDYPVEITDYDLKAKKRNRR